MFLSVNRGGAEIQPSHSADVPVSQAEHKRYGGPMPSPLDPKQIVTFEELPMPQVVEREALTRLFVGGIHKGGVPGDGEGGGWGGEEQKEGDLNEIIAG